MGENCPMTKSRLRLSKHNMASCFALVLMGSLSCLSYCGTTRQVQVVGICVGNMTTGIDNSRARTTAPC